MAEVRYTISVDARAQRELRRLPRQAQRRIAARVDALSADPRPRDTEHLAGTAGLFRIRVGDYRVVYAV